MTKLDPSNNIEPRYYCRKSFKQIPDNLANVFHCLAHCDFCCSGFFYIVLPTMKKLELRDYQRTVFDTYKDKPYGALFLDTGVGKTAVSIKLIEHKIKTKGYKRIIVFGPSAVLINWDKEFDKFYPDRQIPLHISNGSGQKRRKLLDSFCREEAGILVINYEVASSRALAGYVERFEPEVMFLDESHMVKGHKSKRSKFVLALRKKAKECFLLTGTPILNQVTDIFMQYRIMDLGKTFGTNYWVFLRYYMEDKNEKMKGSPYYFPKMVTRESALPTLKEKIETCATYIKKQEVLKELPPLISKEYHLEMTPPQKKAYKELKTDLVTEFKGGFVSVENALTKTLRLNTICAGHLTDNEGEITFFEKTKKLEQVVELVRQITHSGEKVIIWTSFTPEVERIASELKKNKVCKNILYITGKQSAKAKAEAEDQFNSCPNHRVLIANRAAGGTGLNLQAASHSIIYSRNYSLAHEVQSEARNYRSGSEVHSCIVQHNLIMKGTVEEIILEALQKKKDLGSGLLENMKKDDDTSFKSLILNDLMEDDF